MNNCKLNFPRRENININFKPRKMKQKKEKTMKTNNLYDLFLCIGNHCAHCRKKLSKKQIKSGSSFCSKKCVDLNIEKITKRNGKIAGITDC